MSGSQVLWTICGGKGGSGKTFLTANIGLFLAGLGLKAAVCDADAKGPSLHTALGLREKAAPSPLGLSGLSSPIPEPTPFENLAFMQNRKGPGRDEFNISAGNLRGEKYDFVLVDVDAGTGSEAAETLFGSGRGAIVITPEPSCVERCFLFIRRAVYNGLRKAAEKPLYIGYVDEAFGGNSSCNLVRLANQVINRVATDDAPHAGLMKARLGRFSIGVILNKARRGDDEGIGKMFCDTVETLYGPRAVFLGYVPFDERVMIAERKGAPFLREYGASDTAALLAAAGRSLMAETAGAHCVCAGWRELSSLSHYGLLRLPRGASAQDLNSAYIRMISQYSEGSISTYGAVGPAERREILDRIESAFSCLSDPVKRAAYDATLEHDAVEEEPPATPERPECSGGNGHEAASKSRLPPGRISGANLRDVRISKKLSLDEIASLTKIRKAYLEALEKETPEIFPAPVFARGFLKSYAKALGLNPAEVAENYHIMPVEK